MIEIKLLENKRCKIKNEDALIIHGEQQATSVFVEFPKDTEELNKRADFISATNKKFSIGLYTPVMNDYPEDFDKLNFEFQIPNDVTAAGELKMQFAAYKPGDDRTVILYEIVYLWVSEGIVRIRKSENVDLLTEMAEYCAQAGKSASDAKESADGALAVANIANEKSDAAVATANDAHAISEAANARSLEAVGLSASAAATASTANATAVEAYAESIKAVEKADSAIETANTADEQSLQAISISENAELTSQNANSKSDNAVSTANEALNKAEEALATAKTSDGNSAEALVIAKEAKEISESADTKSDGAIVTADEALENSESAIETSMQADKQSLQAIETAQSAEGIAQAAETKANAALSNSNEAIATANVANGKADIADANSVSAVAAANDAKAQANAADTKADTAVGTANEAKNTAQTAKTIAEQARTAALDADNVSNQALSLSNTALSLASTATTKAEIAIIDSASALSKSNQALHYAEQAAGELTQANLNSQQARLEAAEARTLAVDAKLTASGLEYTANHALAKAGDAEIVADEAKLLAGAASNAAALSAQAADDARVAAENAENYAMGLNDQIQAANDTANNAVIIADYASNRADEAMAKAEQAEMTAQGKQDFLGFMPEDSARKNMPDGYAGLDFNGKVPLELMNDAVLGNVQYQDLWNAALNIPDLSVVAPKGHYYVASEGGTQFGIKFEVGDWIISNGVEWGRVYNTDAVSSVAGRTGNVVLNKNDVGLGNVDNTSDANKPISTAQQTALNAKVDKLTGKQLSTEDYTTAEKTKLAGVAANANNYVHPANHAPSVITQDASNRFVTDSEKAAWNAKAEKTAATTTTDGLMSSADKSKLNGIAENANNYSHPANHPPSIITQDASNRFVTDTEKSAWNGKVDKITGKGLSTEDYTSAEKTKLAGIAEGAQVNTITSVAGKTGAVILAKSDVGLSNVDNTSDANKPISTATQTALNNKVDKVTAKQLSTEDYTSAEKSKLAGIQAGAQVNAVTSVAGRTGAVTLAKGDVGLGNVDNTADSAKNVLSATKLTTARTITIQINGTTIGSGSFDGSGNLTINLSSIAATNISITSSTYLGSNTTLQGALTYIANVFAGTQTVTKLKASTFDTP